MSESSNEATVHRVVDAFNRKHLDEVLAEFTPAAALREPFIEEPIAGMDALRDFHAGLFESFPDEILTIVQLISAGDWVVARTTASGTHTGDFLGMRPTGRPFSVPECLVYQFDADGRIANQWTYVDSGSIAKQFGYTFAPASDDAVPS
ncbi:ester cyclase [Plantactinospora sp. GCM10030261]|uniref:ester cyclase n=1 Tax=Plantactinospora sp. GCM10030261 TaxID=3273420 RepID=UPI00360AC7F5